MSGGTLAFNNGNALGTGQVQLDGGMLLGTATATLNNNLDFSASSTIAAAAGATLTLAPPVLTVLVPGETLTFGSGTGTGTVVLTPALSFTFAVDFVVAGGTLQVGNGIFGNLFWSAGSTTVNGGATLDLHGFSLTIGNLQGSGTVSTGGSAGQTLTVSQGDFGGAITGAAGLVKDTSGTLILTGINTYTGGTTIGDGMISVSSDANLGAASGDLTLAGGALQTTASFASARSVTLAGPGGGFDTAAGTTLTLSGNIGGAGALGKIGAGTVHALRRQHLYGRHHR